MDALDAFCLSCHELGDAANGGKRRGHLVLREPDRTLERRLDGGRGQGRAVGKHDSAPQVQPNGESVLLEGPFFAEGRREVALGVGRHEPLVDVGERLLLFVGLVEARLGRGDRVGDGDDERAAARELFFGSRLRGSELLELGLERRGLRVFAAQVGERRGEREEPRQVLGVAARTRHLDPTLGPISRIVDASGLPGRLRDEQDGGCGPARLLFRFEDADSGFRFPERGVDVARHALALCEEQPRLAFPLAVFRVLGVLEVVERDLRDADGVLRAEGVERLLRELQPVLDGLLGVVRLREVVDELRVDALEPPGVALFQELGKLAVERAALAPGQRRVQDVADDPAREGQAVASRLALFLEHPLADETIDVVVEVAVVLGDLLEVLRVEGLSEHGGDREEVAELLREPLDALLDGLLDGRGQGVGRDLGLLGEAPCARVVFRDAA